MKMTSLRGEEERGSLVSATGHATIHSAEAVQNGPTQTPGDGDDLELREAARAWVVSLSSGAITEARMTELRVWLAADARHEVIFNREVSFWRGLDSVRAEFDQPQTQPAAAVAESRRRGVRARAFRPAALWLAAASLAMVFVATDLITWLRSDVATAAGEIRHVSLPDGSEAVLNTNTALTIDYEQNERRISVLKGEAWFHVAKNARRPFRVLAGGGTTEAVGTAFDIKGEQDRVIVTVTEGTVVVASRKDAGQARTQATRVTRGEQVTYSASAVSQPVAATRAEDELLWRDGRVAIEDASLADALHTLERYRRGRIILLKTSAAQERVSGIFSIDKIDQGLDGLAQSYGLRITRVTPFIVLVR
ncbi:MAG: FecR domain-containing protein [Gammaproteobacteria bacterium]